jgi:DNA-binding NarL/FixJ family response regulator
MGACHIILADDHTLFRRSLKRTLEENGDLKVVGEAGDGLELLTLLKEVVPHLIILDISMPNLRGLETMHEIKTKHPEIKVLMLTMHKEKGYLHQAMSAGADGYFLKNDSDTELFSAIEKIRKGEIYVSSSLSVELAHVWKETRHGFRKPVLTNREREVLKLVAEGKSSKQIGDLLYISPHTVDRHRANIMTKLGVNKAADLVKYAIESGYIE